MTHRFLVLQAVLLLLAPLAHAQDDLSILTQSVPPKVMLALDTSGSMVFVINHDSFNADTVRWRFNDRFPVNQRTAAANECNFGNTPEASGTTGLCPGSQHGSGDDRCPDTDDFGTRRSGGSTFWCKNVPGGCANAPTGWTCSVAGIRTNLTLPNYGSNYSTGYQRNYLHWIAQQMRAGVKLTLPATDRISGAKLAIKNLVNGVNPTGVPESVHFGLARFDVNSNGGYVLVSAQAASKTAIFAALDTASTGVNSTFPNGGTPLSEFIVDIARYFAGSDNLGNYPTYSHTDTTGSVPGSPFDAKCRAGFIVLVTDGAPTSDLNDHYGTAFMDTIGNADGDDNENPTPWGGRTPTPYVLPYDTGSGSDWLNDVGYYLARVDLKPGLDEEQKLITYTVGFTISHPLLDETATYGMGEYFTTSNSAQLEADLEAALVSIIERSSALTSATVPASRSAFGDGFYTAFFIPSASNPFWEGHLQAYRLTPDLVVVDPNNQPALDPATNLFTEPRNPFWDAGVELAKVTHPTRKLYTTLSVARADFTAANIAAANLGLLAGELTAYPNDPAVPFANLEALADGIVNYMKGEDAFDDDRDTNKTEKRSAVLGDIFHSNPISVGPPPGVLQDEDGFGPVDQTGTFLYDFHARDRLIYAGANDGFLHGFNGGSSQTGDNIATPETENGYYTLGTGQELFGYVPGSLLDDVKMIPRNLPRSKYFVDGSPAASDIWIPSSSVDVTKTADEWATALVTGMRQGGAGYLALDITDPSANDPNTSSHAPFPKFLWEFDDSAEPLGEAWSQPIITRVKTKGATGVGDHCGRDTTDDGDCREQWVVIIGGGYRAQADPNLATFVSDPNGAGFTTASKAIFILAADTGQVLARVAYDAADTTLSRMQYSLPSTPAVLDLDQDGLADVVYVGDLGGQVWKWDIHEIGTDTDLDGVVDNWPAGVFFSSPPANMGDLDADGDDDFHYHSIFFPPIATYLNDKLLLAFGSGERTSLKYEGPSNKDDNNRFWVVRDRMPTGATAFDVELSEGYQTVAGVTRGINDITSLASDPAPDDDGYYIVVPDGEKFIVNSIVFGGLALALSYVPDNTGADICNSTGSTNLYVFGISDGLGALTDSGSQTRVIKLGNGAPTDPKISVSRDSSGNMIVELVGQTSLGEVTKVSVPVTPQEPFEKVYWRQRF